MALALLIGRVIFGLYWLNAAYSHFKNASGMAGYAASKGVKAPKAAVIVSGILALLGGLSVLSGAYTGWGIAALIVFLIGVSFGIHPYWKIGDAGAKMGERVNFWKNMALIGALLMMLAIPAPWVYSFGW